MTLVTLVASADTDGVWKTGTLEFLEPSPGTEKATVQPGTMSSDITLTLPVVTSTIVSDSSTATLTNKTIDADGTGNSISNIENADIKAAAGIDATKVSAGDVDNTEFDFLNGVTSAIQTQIDAQIEDATGTVDSDNILDDEIVDADINSSAAITRTKIANGTPDNVVINSATGVMSEEAQLAVTRGGTGQDFSTDTGVIKVVGGTFASNANINDLNDVDAGSATEDQVLQYNSSNSKWEAVDGAFGDNSFKPVRASATTVEIKLGIKRHNGDYYCTYDGSGSTSADITNVTHTPSLGASTTYRLYIDKSATSIVTLTDIDLDCRMVEAADFYISSTPESVNEAEYIPIGTITSDGSSQIAAASDVYDLRPEESVSWANLKLYEDKIANRRQTDSGQSIPNNTDCIIDYEDNKTGFTDENYTVGSGYTAATCTWSTEPKWTAPRAGKYKVCAQAMLDSSTWGDGTTQRLLVKKNGTLDHRLKYKELPSASSSILIVVSGCTLVELDKDDYIQIVIKHTKGSANVLNNTAENNVFSIHEATNAETSAVATTNNTGKIRVTSAAAQGSCEANYSQIDVDFDPEKHNIQIDYYDNSATVKLIKAIDDGDAWLDAKVKALDSDTICVDWGASAFDTDDYADIFIGPGPLVTALPWYEPVYVTTTSIFDITSDDWQNVTDYQLSIPGSGWYEVACSGCAILNFTTATQQEVSVRIYNTTDGEELALTPRRMRLSASAISEFKQSCFHLEKTEYFDGPKTIDLQAKETTSCDGCKISYLNDRLEPYCMYQRLR